MDAMSLNYYLYEKRFPCFFSCLRAAGVSARSDGRFS